MRLKQNWLDLYLASGLNHVRVLKAMEDKREVWPAKVDKSWMVVQHAGHSPGAALGLPNTHRHQMLTPRTLLPSAEVQQSFVADGRICRIHLSEAPAQ